MVTQFPVVNGNVINDSDVNSSYFQASLATTMNHASKNIANTDTTIIAANASRKGIILYNNGTATIYIGLTGVTTSTGYPLPSDETIYLYNKEEIHGITASTTEDLRYMEVQ